MKKIKINKKFYQMENQVKIQNPKIFYRWVEKDCPVEETTKFLDRFVRKTDNRIINISKDIIPIDLKKYYKIK